MFPLTEKTFFQFVKCPDWVYRDVQEDREQAQSALQQHLLVNGLLPEVVQGLLAHRPDLVSVLSEDQEEAFFETVRAMKEGRGTILRPVLVDGSWVARPDFLERVEGNSRLGGHYYVAVDVKRARSLREEYTFQGCFYADLLYAIQGVKPLFGYVLTPDKQVLSYTLSESELEYRRLLHAIERARAGERQPHLLTSGCKQSPWFESCCLDAESSDDIVRINRIWQDEVDALRRAGVRTVKQFADASPTFLLSHVSGIREIRLMQLRDQAIALTTGIPLIRAPIDIPAADHEWYFDVESDPLRDQDFLFGVLEVSRGEALGHSPTGEAIYHAFFAKSPAEEKTMWEQFCALLEQHPESPLYHYGYFEQEVIARFLSRFGASESLRILFAQQMIDLLERLRGAVHFPFSFYSLKDIAKFIGYRWKEAEATGVSAVQWFEEYLINPRKRSVLNRILAYNEDDVRATWAVKQWLEQHTKRL